MTRDEFARKYPQNYLRLWDKTVTSWEEQFSSYEQQVEEHRKAEDLFQWALIEFDERPDIFLIIYAAVFTKSERDDYEETMKTKVKSLVKSHMERGDFEEWFLTYYSYGYPRFRWLSEEKVVKKQLTNVYQEKIEEHRSKGDLIDFLWDFLDSKNLRWVAVYDFACGVQVDVGDEDLAYKIGTESKQYEFEHRILYELLTGEERNELGRLHSVIVCLENVPAHTAFGYDLSLSNRDRDYIFSLLKSQKNSVEYKRYEKIRSRLIDEDDLDEFDDALTHIVQRKEEKIREEQFKKRLLTVGSIVGAVLLIITVSAFFIYRSVTKEVRLAKKEARRIERVNAENARLAEKEAQRVKKENAQLAEQEANRLEKLNAQNAKELAQNQANDLAQLEKLGSTKGNLLNVLVPTAEPSMYVIAPMTYDTQKFIQDNSHDSALFGLSEKDNSVERLNILESCITDFMNSVDYKTGVSFLDRSKISQIEKEHQFQLGDWSNDSKTAEVGKALNANILLFLDKFGFIDNGSGEYRFEAKFVDINTMQSASYNVVYQNAKKKVVTPQVVETISFKDFTPVSTKNNSFNDELSLKAIKTFRTVQNINIKETSPLGQITKIDLSEFDTKAPVTDLFNVTSIYFDGFDEVEFKYSGETETATYTFEAIEKNLERIDDKFYTDGKIGMLTIKTDSGYQKYDIFTENNREYYLHVGAAVLEKATVNYYLQLIKQ